MWSVIKCVDGIKKVVAEVYSSLLHHRHAVVVLVLLIEILCTSQRTKTASWRWWWWWCWRCGGSELVIVVMVVVVLEFFGSRYQSLVRFSNWPERAGWEVWLVDGWWGLVAEEKTRAFCGARAVLAVPAVVRRNSRGSRRWETPLRGSPFWSLSHTTMLKVRFYRETMLKSVKLMQEFRWKLQLMSELPQLVEKVFFGALCTIDEKRGFLDQMSILITWDRFSWLKAESWAINHEKVMVTVSRRRLPNKVRDKLVPVLPSLIWPPLRPWPTHCLLCSQLPDTFSQPTLPPTHTFRTGWKTMTFSCSAFPHQYCRKQHTLWCLLLKNSDIFLSDISSSSLPFFSCYDNRTDYCL